MVLLSRLGEWLVCYKMAAVLRTLNVLFPCDALIRLPCVVGSCGRFMLLTLKLSLFSRTSEESQRAEPVWHAGSRRWPSVSSGTPLIQASRAAFRRHSFVRAANLKQHRLLRTIEFSREVRLPTPTSAERLHRALQHSCQPHDDEKNKKLSRVPVAMFGKVNDVCHRTPRRITLPSTMVQCTLVK